MAIYKRGREFELGPTEHKIKQVARAGFEPGTAGLRVRRADHSATMPAFKISVSVPCEQSENVEWFHVNEVFGQIF